MRSRDDVTCDTWSELVAQHSHLLVNDWDLARSQSIPLGGNCSLCVTFRFRRRRLVLDPPRTGPNELERDFLRPQLTGTQYSNFKCQ